LNEAIPNQADIGLLRVNNAALKQKLVPGPSKIIEKLKVSLPNNLKVRSTEIRDWINKSMLGLKSSNSSIDEFVRVKNHYNYVDNLF